MFKCESNIASLRTGSTFMPGMYKRGCTISMVLPSALFAVVQLELPNPLIQWLFLNGYRKVESFASSIALHLNFCWLLPVFFINFILSSVTVKHNVGSANRVIKLSSYSHDSFRASESTVPNLTSAPVTNDPLT